MIKLDLLDQKILYELDLNARLSSSQLAKKLRKSKETVNFRVNRLLQNKTINYFYSVLNTSKLGLYYIKVYLKFRDITPQMEQEIFDYLAVKESISYLASVEGYYDCIFLVMVKNSVEMLKFMDTFMGKYGAFIQEKDLVDFMATHRLNQRFLYEGKEQTNLHYSPELDRYELDTIDQQILYYLSANARMSLISLAKEISVDAKVIKYHLKKLEKDKIILGYVTSPNFNQLGFKFVQLNISLKDPSIRNSIITYFSQTKKCLFAIELLGKYDLTIEVHVKDPEELRVILDGFKEKFTGKYNHLDQLNVNKEYLMVWSPFKPIPLAKVRPKSL